ncbi:GNAT family N-acetyltransferase [Azohydromonas lata]|uniref:GNAT family N-acetyltransferase n=1 Tax=Azohydromonas lata TaxID=45677 RepID=UPI0009FF7846|nr:GNAT family N-acetyltransferase [Azohydromonas lata]
MSAVADVTPAQAQAQAQRLRWRCEPFETLDVASLYALLQLRSQIFVVEQNCVYLDPDGADLHCHHLLGFDGEGRLQAALRLVPPGLKYGEASMGRVVTSAAVRGSGVGHALVAQGLRESARIHPGHGLRISAQAHLQRFYEAHGFRAEGETYLEDDIPHIEMSRGAPSAA